MNDHPDGIGEDARRMVAEAKGSSEPIACPQCETPTTDWHEGLCERCCRSNQFDLDRHIAEVERWDRMSNREKSDAIRREM